jgi:hypothetical protein
LLLLGMTLSCSCIRQASGTPVIVGVSLHVLLLLQVCLWRVLLVRLLFAVLFRLGWEWFRLKVGGVRNEVLDASPVWIWRRLAQSAGFARTASMFEFATSCLRKWKIASGYDSASNITFTWLCHALLRVRALNKLSNSGVCIPYPSLFILCHHRLTLDAAVILRLGSGLILLLVAVPVHRGYTAWLHMKVVVLFKRDIRWHPVGSWSETFSSSTTLVLIECSSSSWWMDGPRGILIMSVRFLKELQFWLQRRLSQTRWMEQLVMIFVIRVHVIRRVAYVRA